MTMRHMAFLGLTIEAALWNALPWLSRPEGLDWLNLESAGSMSGSESSHVLHLTRDDFASLADPPTGSARPGNDSWSSLWVTPAWGDWPGRVRRAVSTAFGLKQVHWTDRQFLTVVLVSWWSVCAVFAARAWTGNDAP